MRVFHFLGISAVLLCLCLPAYADLAVPSELPPPPIETEFETEPASPDISVPPEGLPGYMGEQKPEFPMELPPPPVLSPPVSP